MGVYKDNRPTNDGRVWFFKLNYEDIDGTKKPKKSGRYATKKEAEEAEFEFKRKLHDHINQNEITFEEMINLFLNFKKKRVRETTYYNYGNKIPYLKPLFKVKLKDFTYTQFERWHDYIDSTNLKTRTKNDIYKFLKSVMNFATKWYEFSFIKVYPKMTNFTNPNELPEEQQCFTYEEFKQFLSVENDLRWKCTFEVLYYCGLRRGELRGLQWKDVDLDKSTLSVTKQLTDRSGTVKQIRLHDFRHSCASLLINKGANVKIVAKYLGHTKEEETLRTYSHLFLSSLDELIDVIDNLEK